MASYGTFEAGKGGEGSISEWDTSLGCGLRLHDLLKEANHHSKIFGLLLWKTTLDAIFREISSVLSRVEIVECEGVKRVTDTKISVFLVLQNKVLANNLVKNDELGPTYQELHEYEMLLREKAESHGLLHKKVRDAKKSMLE